MQELAGKVEFPVVVDHYIAAGNQDALAVLGQVHAVEQALAESLVGVGIVPVVVRGAVLLVLGVVEVELIGEAGRAGLHQVGVPLAVGVLRHRPQGDRGEPGHRIYYHEHQDLHQQRHQGGLHPQAPELAG